VALSGRRLLVGKYVNDFTSSVPSLAYLYERRNQWLPVAELVSENSDFNVGIAVSGNIAIVNASDFAYNRPGYVFQLPDLETLPALSAVGE
jgi:hypothetical protein